MSTVNQVLQNLIRKDPASYTNQLEALNYILTNINNGHEWNEHGEIESITKQENWNSEQILSIIKDNNFPPLIEKALLSQANQRIGANDSVLRSLDVEPDYSVFEDDENELLVNDNSLIMTMPDNVTDEWNQTIKDFIGNRKLTPQSQA